MTLIEVLLATTIMAISLTALLGASSRCIAVMRAARYYQSAQWALSLGELEHPTLPVKEVEEWEVRGKRYGDLTYEREVEPRDEAEEDGLFVLQSRVTWSDRGRELSEEVVRYVFIRDKMGPTR